LHDVAVALSNLEFVMKVVRYRFAKPLVPMLTFAFFGAVATASSYAGKSAYELVDLGSDTAVSDITADGRIIGWGWRGWFSSICRRNDDQILCS